MFVKILNQESTIMTSLKDLTPEAQNIWKLLNNTRAELQQNTNQLTEQDLSWLLAQISSLWSYTIAQQQSLLKTADGISDDDPFWMAARMAGIVIEQCTTTARGEEVLVWIWSVSEAHKRVSPRGGFETKFQALRAALIWLVECASAIHAEEQVAIGSDTLTFDSWKAIKQQAGTWDFDNPPEHHALIKDDELEED